MSPPIDHFIADADVRKRHEILVRAPANLVLDTARKFDMHSVPLVRAIFWLRGKALGAKVPGAESSHGLVEDTLAMGWGVLAEENGRFFMAGAVCQPWLADVVFTPIPPDQFAAFSEPDCVKIVWTLEVEALSGAVTRFITETRVVATDDQSRIKFRRYWRRFGLGIRMIRWLLLPAVRHQAERRWHATENT